MNSNIVKSSLSSDINRLKSIFSPTQLYTGIDLNGESSGGKKYLKIIYANPDSSSFASIDADGRIFELDVSMECFSNTANVTCADSIFVDDANQKVYFYKNVFEYDTKTIVSKIGVNKIYDTHSTFQLKTSNPIPENEKKNGIANLYSKKFITHKQSSPSIYDSGIVGADTNGFIYIKIKADDENYFYNGERIANLEMFKLWVNENNLTIMYERKNPIITDITDTRAGQILLGLQPDRNFHWTIENAGGELCVYRDIDDVLTEIKALILE